MVISRLSEPGPEVDNLYLDMNGIIHVCCRTEESDIHSSENTTEEMMIRSIYSYIEHIFQSIRPRKRFFMAIDGVAPRAKLNQQRQRRFRKVMSADLQVSNSEFDSNCITPGTTFMLRLSACLEYFVNHKVSTNAAWRSCEIMYSSHRDPGEGEHKIMDFIRSQRADTDFASETHCLYGLDADLIMLALSTHMPNFILLREVVNFGSHWKENKKMDKMMKKKISEDKSLKTPSEFVLLHIRILRDYLCCELHPKNLESAIDDFIFLCFLLGNDFLPGLPGLSIADGAISDLLEVYSRVCIKSNRCIVQDGCVNYVVLKDILLAIAKDEWKFIQNRMNSFKKKSRDAEPGILNNVKTIAEYKAIYYGQKLHFTDKSERHTLAIAYIEGLIWVFNYYFSGCPDWAWYYRYHYAPLASDLIEAVNSVPDIHFTQSEPFTPYEQLLAVLPVESHACVPRSLEKLMTDPGSVLHRNGFYPKMDEIQIDREGYKYEWEGVMLLPFIDEAFLKSVFREISTALSHEEKANNRNEPSLTFKYDLNVAPTKEITPPIQTFPAIANSYVKRSVLDVQNSNTKTSASCQIMLPGSIGSIDPLKEHLSTSLVSRETQVFGQFSRNPSMIIDLSERVINSEIFHDAVGQIISVGFPFLKKALLLSVHEEDGIFQGTFDHKGKLLERRKCMHTPDEKDFFRSRVQKITKDRLASCGMRIAAKQSLLHVRHILGTRVTDTGLFAFHFENAETIYPAQVCIAEDGYGARFTSNLTKEAILMKEALVFPAHKHFQTISHGSVGQIQHVHTKRRNGFYLRMTFPQEMRVDDHLFYNALPARVLLFASPQAWVSSIDMCRDLKIPHQLLFLICETILCEIDGETIQIGLQIIDRQSNLGRTGYVRCIKNIAKYKTASSNPMVLDLKIDEDFANTSEKQSQRKWVFSHAARSLIQKYLREFGSFARSLPLESRESIDVRMLCESDEKLVHFRLMLNRIQTFLNEHGSFLLSNDSKVFESKLGRADENALSASAVADIEQTLIENQSIRIPTMAQDLDNIPLLSIFIPLITQENSTTSRNHAPSYLTHPNNVLQRVVFCGATGTVPFGAKGCVIRLTADGYHAEVLFDDVYLECDRLGGRLKTFRGSVINKSDLFVIHSPEIDAPKKQASGATKFTQSKHSKAQSKRLQRKSEGTFAEENMSEMLQSDLLLEHYSPSDQNAAANDKPEEETRCMVASEKSKQYSPIKKNETGKTCIFGDSCLITNPTHLQSFH